MNLGWKSIIAIAVSLLIGIFALAYILPNLLVDSVGGALSNMWTNLGLGIDAWVQSWAPGVSTWWDTTTTNVVDWWESTTAPVANAFVVIPEAWDNWVQSWAPSVSSWWDDVVWWWNN